MCYSYTFCYKDFAPTELNFNNLKPNLKNFVPFNLLCFYYFSGMFFKVSFR